MSKKRPRKKARSAGSIALCMIVRDEEANLGRCLESVSGLVSEIDIVDTGSGDDTIQIAKSHGARVRREKWADDFSRARNVSLHMARTDWILVLDADEVLSPEGIPKIRAAVRNSDVSAYLLPTRNYTNDPTVANFVPNDGSFGPALDCEGWVESRKIRLFRKLPGIRFEGEVHEAVGPAIRHCGGREEFLDAVVHHFGYLASEDSLRRKTERIASLAEAKCASQPDNYQAHYELGVISARLGNLEKAERCLREAVALRTDFAIAHYDLGVVLSKAGRDEEAVFEYQAALKFDPNSSDALNNLADALQRLRRYEEAERAYGALLVRHPSHKRGWSNLGTLLASTGRQAEAEQAFKNALRIDPNFSDALQNLRILSAASPDSPTLCLLMIVRNERQNLSETLPQVARCFDEIVIVDTGSEDDTMEVAKKFTEKTFAFPWTDDFSAARNFALTKARADWILWLDADDRMTPRDVTLLKRHISGDRKGYLIRVVSDSSGSGTAQFLQLRLFPNVEGIRWEGRVHEQVLPSLQRKGLGVEAVPDVTVVHKGYDDPATLKEKTIRNLRLLEEERRLRPDDPHVLQHIAQAYALLGDIDKAVEASEALVDAPASQARDAFLTHTLNRLIQYNLLLNNVKRAKHWADRVLQTDPQDRLVRFFLGEICYQEGSLVEAIGWFERFCEAEEVVGCAPVPWRTLTANARNYLGLAYERIGRRDKARSEFRAAIELGARLEAYKNLARMHLEDGDPAGAASVLQAATKLEGGDAGVWTNLGVAMARSGKFDEAAESLRKALEIEPANAAAKQNLTKLEGMAGHAPSLAKSFTLSTCIIAKNEAASLRDAVESVAPVSDEVIVVDTGSTDDTVEVARSCGAVVKTMEWADDFSAARNVSLGFASCEWILVIDADEVVAAEDLRKLARLGPEPNVWGYSMVTRNYSSDRHVIGWQRADSSDELARGQPGWFPSTKVRLFRNNPKIRFEGRVHECVEPSILKAGKRIERLDVPVHHYGCIRDDGEKRHYYLELAEMKARENVRDSRANYELGIQCMVAGKLEEAEIALAKAVELDPHNEAALINMGGVRIKLGKLSEAAGLLERAVALNPNSGCAHYNLGVALEKMGRFDEAEVRYSKAHALDQDDANALAKLGYLCARKGDMQAARERLERALALDPQNQHARNNLEYVRTKLPGLPLARCDLSLNMIVRDEEDNLKEGLAPVAALFDEIVVVDTGSSDGTVEAAERLGARVIHHPWNDDFAEARNVALKNSRGSWIFWLDADDRIEPRAVNTLRKFIARGIPCGAFFPLESALGDNGSVVQNYTLRLFPNRPGIAWAGAVHEQIAGSLRASGIELVNCPDFKIRHVGYEKRGEALRKNLRNLNLLAKEIVARPEDPYIMFALAQAFLFCGQVQHAARWLRLLWNMRGKADGAAWKEVFWMAAIVLSDCAARSGDAAEAEQWLEHAIELVPDNWLAHFLLGEKKFLGGDLARASHLIGEAARIGVSPTILPLDLDQMRGKLERYLSKLKEVEASTALGRV